MTDLRYPTHLALLRASTADLLHSLNDSGWSDADARGASLLPGWTRGHVLTHIARNADGISHTLAGALRGERVVRYPNGPAGRDADIEAGARRPATELVHDVRDSADRLDRVFGAVADADGWALPADDRSCGDYLLARWREVEIHRVDAGTGYLPSNWPPAFVRYLLPELADGLAERASGAVRMIVAETGSVAPDLAGREWRSGPGPAVDVRGPDWALLCWLVGRPQPAAEVLATPPDLASWL